jgi:phage portal protein BeeE
MKSFIANVRIRKQDRSGNTYHDVQLLDMDGNVLSEKEKVYGYGQQYKQTTADMINEHEKSDFANYYNVSDMTVFIANHY